MSIEPLEYFVFTIERRRALWNHLSLNQCRSRSVNHSSISIRYTISTLMLSCVRSSNAEEFHAFVPINGSYEYELLHTMCVSFPCVLKVVKSQKGDLGHCHPSIHEFLSNKWLFGHRVWISSRGMHANR